MLRSMTGFGFLSRTESGKSFVVEIKSLNSKSLDLTLRIPRSCSEFEPELRNLISEKLERGKVSLSVDILHESGISNALTIDENLLSAYFTQFGSLAKTYGIPVEIEIFKMAMNAPGVLQASVRDSISSEEKEALFRSIFEACEKCDEFRSKEGFVLEEKIRAYISRIFKELEEVRMLDPKRIDRVRSKLTAGIGEWLGNSSIDSNRLEQEMIYYIERLDIQEELVRLKSHLDYFIETINTSRSPGRKLVFISQEIGREINTIGSKASDAAIQTHVVVMKEELEKIKEQLNNIL